MAVATLALAIGANTAIFTIADAVLFRPLPFADPSRINVVTVRDRRSGTLLPSVPIDYVMAIDAHHRGLGRVGLRGPTLMMTHSGTAEAEGMETFAVSPEYFEVLGVRPARGRLFDNGDVADPGRAAILTFDSWQTRFGGDEGIIGRAVKLGARERDIIGVLPRGFAFPATSLHFQYSLTGKPAFVTTAPAESADPNDDVPPLVIGGAATNPVARLEPGVSREQAQAELDALVAPIRASRASGPDELIVLSDPRSVLFPTGRPIMAWLVAAAGLVLLIAAANLAAMLLARTRRRDREIGLHLALGATRARILWPIFFETLIIGAAAAVVAFMVTLSTFDLLLRQVPPAAYGVASVQVDARVAVFALVLGVAAGLIFAVVPAWWSANLDVRLLVNGRPRHKSPRRRVFGHPLITAQVMLAIVLVFGAVVAGRAFVSMLTLPLGFTADNVVALNALANPDKSRTLRGYYLQAVDALASRGDVIAASAGGSIPPDGFRAVEVIELAGRPAAGVVHVLPGYFQVLGIPLVRGRLFTPRDVASADTAVLSQSAARALFPDREALGATFRDRGGRPFTVIGIVGDVRRSLNQNLDPPAYVIPPDSTTRGLTIVARMRDRQTNTVAELRRELARLAPETPVTGVWWSDSISALTPYRTPRFQSLVLGTFAVLALGLTALGIFAAVASFVAARTRELGVRLALGASPQLLIRSTVVQSLVPVVSGVVLGVIATEWLRRIAATQLIELDIVRHGALTMGVTVAVVAAAALAAAYFPARYASRIDPAVVLRAE